MNGVTGSVLHILRHLERRGHEALVLAPRAAGMPDDVHGARVEPVSSMALPGYRDVRVGSATAHRLAVSLERFAPDVVHLASPFALGWRGVLAADRLDIATVAAYQTDVAGYTERYRLPATTTIAQSHVSRLHRRATLTLSPSSASDDDLVRWGVDRVRRWGEGSTPSASTPPAATTCGSDRMPQTSSSATSAASPPRNRSTICACCRTSRGRGS
ncbi:glycosyltransferase [Microbacterium sp. NIBRBAC000506063]|uniref:glycosyltransferase n=1 Tax=Microbacterium sp. NIBRBAC000506063 TaxID=2734618 RepID=UPI002948BEC2|nr:glycosyltransferase [Microbacterium sp. NIBRBAC000506063]